MASGDSIEELIDSYPSITIEDVNACLLFAADTIKNEIVIPRAS
jgi:uncharacterized protein (DUF433 family)